MGDEDGWNKEYDTSWRTDSQKYEVGKRWGGEEWEVKSEGGQRERDWWRL